MNNPNGSYIGAGIVFPGITNGMEYLYLQGAFNLEPSEEYTAYAVQSSMLLFVADAEPLDKQQLMWWLEGQVKDLLDRDFNRLVNLLYRIDVSERKAKHCFGQSNAGIAKCLAELIWERQLQKAKTRFSG